MTQEATELEVALAATPRRRWAVRDTPHATGGLGT